MDAILDGIKVGFFYSFDVTSSLQKTNTHKVHNYHQKTIWGSIFYKSNKNTITTRKIVFCDLIYD
jgi:hypothetical protein